MSNLGDEIGSWIERNANPLILVLAIIAGALVVVLLSGCTWSEQTRERVVEHNRVTGSVAGAPVELDHRRTLDRQQQTEGERDSGMSEIASVVGSAASATPWGGIVGTVLAAGAGFLALRKDKQAKAASRQRDELIDGVESAKDHIDADTWAKVKKSLADNQSDDTAKAVQERTA